MEVVIEARVSKLEDGCKYGQSCLKCAHPLKNGDCLLYWYGKTRDKYLRDRKENPHPLLIKFGSDIGKKPGRNKFALISCYQCNRKRWVHFPYDIKNRCGYCRSMEALEKAWESQRRTRGNGAK